jgi:signal transduction histidine kinase
VILNKERQVVFCNDHFLDLLDNRRRDQVYGMRAGEVLDCINASRTGGGCGTSVFCRECGFVNAVLTAQKGRSDVQECRILRKNTGDALDLRVRTSQFFIAGAAYTITSLMDIRHEKRRRVLERIFFHDIMNTAVAVRGLSELLEMADSVDSQQEDLIKMVHRSAEKLVDEIQAQKDLMAAENNEYHPQLQSIDSIDFLHQVIHVYKMHEVARDRYLQLDADARRMTFQTDSTLLFRVLSNMTKNALEASAPGETVTLSCTNTENKVQFTVHNPSCMSPEIQHQIFLRSFSTKGVGRGLGTYSIKLLSERYLKGEVSFTSTREHGTTFYALYPMEWTH